MAAVEELRGESKGWYDQPMLYTCKKFSKKYKLLKYCHIVKATQRLNNTTLILVCLIPDSMFLIRGYTVCQCMYLLHLASLPWPCKCWTEVMLHEITFWPHLSFKSGFLGYNFFLPKADIKQNCNLSWKFWVQYENPYFTKIALLGSF